MTTWTPLRSYSGYNHVLGAAACFVHPKNGNIYYWACEQKAGKAQNLTIYREVAATGAWETVVTFEGTIDADAHIERGGCVIAQGGALRVATSLTPKGVPYVTTTGFQGVRCSIPDIDEPWSLASGGDAELRAEVAELRKLADHLEYLNALQQQRIDAIQAALETVGMGDYPAGDKELVKRLRDFLRPLLGA